MPDEVGAPGAHGTGVLRLQVRQGDAAVVFQCPHRRDDHRQVGGEAALAGHDVDVLLRSEIRAETRFRHDDVAELRRRTRGDDGVRAVGDVGEGPSVDERGGALQGLDEVRGEGVAEHSRHGSDGAEIRRGDGLSGRRRADDDPPEPLAQVREGVSHAEGGHHLGRRRDVETRLPRDSSGPAPQAGDDAAQCAIVDVDGPADRHAARIDVVRAEVQRVVDHRGQQVVRLGDGGEIAGEVEVDLVAGSHLGLSPADGSALDAEDRPHGRLAEGEHRAPAYPREAVGQADRRGRLPLACGRRGDSGDQDDPGIPLGQASQIVEIDLRLAVAVDEDVLVRDSQGGGNVPHRPDGDSGFSRGGSSGRGIRFGCSWHRSDLGRRAGWGSDCGGRRFDPGEWPELAGVHNDSSFLSAHRGVSFSASRRRPFRCTGRRSPCATDCPALSI